MPENYNNFFQNEADIQEQAARRPWGCPPCPPCRCPRDCRDCRWDNRWGQGGQGNQGGTWPWR